MSDRLEQLVLSGELFQGGQGDGFGPEPSRSPGSSNAGSVPNTDDELGSDLSDNEGASVPSTAADAAGPERSGARTGPKGVIRDRDVQRAADKEAHKKRIRETNARMAKMALSTRTWDQDERARRKEERAAAIRRGELDSDDADSDDDDEEEAQAGAGPGQRQDTAAESAARDRRRAARFRELQRQQGRKVQLAGEDPGPDGAGKGRKRWFGHLREVDDKGYVAAIDSEEPDVPVVVHIYAKSVPACAVLTSSLASLARQYPRTKFLQVRATAIGFGCKLANDAEDQTDPDEPPDRLRELEMEEEAAVVLPTLLVYLDGGLVANLVRVDMEEGWGRGDERSMRDLLARYGILPDIAALPRSDESDDDQQPDSDLEDD